MVLELDGPSLRGLVGLGRPTICTGSEHAVHELCDAALSGDADRAQKIDEKLVALHGDLFIQSNPIPVKWAVHKLGYCDPAIRLPMTWLTEKEQGVVEKAMSAADL